MRVYLTGYYLRICMYFCYGDLVQSIGYEILGRIIYCYCRIHFSNGKLFGYGDAWSAMLHGFKYGFISHFLSYGDLAEKDFEFYLDMT